MRNEIFKIDEINLEQAWFDVEIANIRILELTHCLTTSTTELALIRKLLAEKHALPLKKSLFKHDVSGGQALFTKIKDARSKNSPFRLLRDKWSRKTIKAHIDNICGKATNGNLIIHIHRGSHKTFKLQGWAFPMPALTVFKSIEIALVNGSERVSGEATVLPRPDLVSHFQNNKILMSGINWTRNMDDLPSGEYNVEITGVNTDGMRRQSRCGKILIDT